MPATLRLVKTSASLVRHLEAALLALPPTDRPAYLATARDVVAAFALQTNVAATGPRPGAPTKE